MSGRVAVARMQWGWIPAVFPTSDRGSGMESNVERLRTLHCRSCVPSGPSRPRTLLLGYSLRLAERAACTRGSLFIESAPRVRCQLCHGTSPLSALHCKAVVSASRGSKDAHRTHGRCPNSPVSSLRAKLPAVRHDGTLGFPLSQGVFLSPLRAC